MLARGLWVRDIEERFGGTQGQMRQHLADIKPSSRRLRSLLCGTLADYYRRFARLARHLGSNFKKQRAY